MTQSNPGQPCSAYPAMTPEEVTAERRAALRWGAIIVAILGTSFTTAMVMLYVSGSDPSFAVEPDYYDKAVDWDAHAAQRTTNERLGWRVELRSAPSSTLGQRDLTVTLTDADGAPIEDATIGVVAFHNARAADRFGFAMSHQGDGVFSATQPLRRPGKWEFRFTVVSPVETFTATTLTDLAPISGGGPR